MLARRALRAALAAFCCSFDGDDDGGLLVWSGAARAVLGRALEGCSVVFGREAGADAGRGGGGGAGGGTLGQVVPEAKAGFPSRAQPPAAGGGGGLKEYSVEVRGVVPLAAASRSAALADSLMRSLRRSRSFSRDALAAAVSFTRSMRSFVYPCVVPHVPHALSAGELLRRQTVHAHSFP